VITPSHEDYSSIRATWISNGRPFQFDMAGSFGGALYLVYDRDDDEPDFHRSFSMGPTVVNNETGRVESEGWQLINRRYLRQRFRVDWEGQIKIRRPVLPDKLD